jgi:DNA polymerase-3 subunit delta
MPSSSTTTIHPVYAIVGKELFLRQRALREILDRLAPEMDDMGLVRLNGAQTEKTALFDETRTSSLLGGRRVVVLDDADKFIKTHRAAIETFFKNLPLQNTLILICDELPSNTNIHKRVAERGVIVACQPPSWQSLVPWLERHAGTVHGKRLHHDAAKRLVDYLGDSLGILDAEIAKLSSYTAERPEISLDDVETLTGHCRSEIIFRVYDAMVDGNAELALTRLQQAYSMDRSAADRSIGGLLYSVRQHKQGKRKERPNANPVSSSRSSLGGSSPAATASGSRPAPLLDRLLTDLLAADLASKTGAATAESAVERLAVKYSYLFSKR